MSLEYSLNPQSTVYGPRIQFMSPECSLSPRSKVISLEHSLRPKSTVYVLRVQFMSI